MDRGRDHAGVALLRRAEVGRVESVEDELRGRIAAEWRKADGRLTLNVTVPANTTATVSVPCSEAQSVRESGELVGATKGIRLLRTEKGRAVLEVSSGIYRIESVL